MSDQPDILQQIFKNNPPPPLNEKKLEFPTPSNETSIVVLVIDDLLTMYQQNPELPYAFGNFPTNQEGVAQDLQKWVLLTSSLNGWQSVSFYKTKCVLSASSMQNHFECVLRM